MVIGYPQDAAVTLQSNKFNLNHSVVRIQGDYFFRSFSLIIDIIKESIDIRNIENIIIIDIDWNVLISATSSFVRWDSD